MNTLPKDVTAKRRLGRPKDEALTARRREEILEAATRIFAEHGYPNTDVQEVADVLGVGKGTIYRYFPSKENLFLAAVDRGMQHLSARLGTSRSKDMDPLKRIATAIRSYLAFFDEHPQLVELLVLERAEFKDRKKPTYFEHRDANLGPWQTLIQELISEGRIREMPVHRITDVINDLLYGTIFTNHFADRRKPLEAQAQDVLDIIFHGILTETEKRQCNRGGLS